MARVDVHRLKILRDGLRIVAAEWVGIKVKVKIDKQSSKDNQDKAEVAAKRARQRALHFLRYFFDSTGHEGPLFANWAIQVVDAFGLDSFPTYQPRPPIIREENADNKSRQRRQRLRWRLGVETIQP
jgi:hypothetical protein